MMTAPPLGLACVEIGVHEFTQPPTDPSLAELEALAAAWLGEGARLFEDLECIARARGKPCETRTWRSLELVDGDVSMSYIDRLGTFVPTDITDAYRRRITKMLPARTRRISILIGTAQVCRMTITNDPQELRWGDDVFVPGRWISRVLAWLPAARRQEAEAAARAEQARINQLKERLLFGKEI